MSVHNSELKNKKTKDNERNQKKDEILDKLENLRLKQSSSIIKNLNTIEKRRLDLAVFI